MADEMSPVELLRAAAAEVRGRGKAATPGPWRTHDTYLNAGGYTATVLSGQPGQSDLRAWLPTRSNEPWDEGRNVWNDAAWIALLHPGLAEPLAAALDYAARTAEYLQRRGHQPAPDGWTQRMIAVARVLLGVPE